MMNYQPKLHEPLIEKIAPNLPLFDRPQMGDLTIPGSC